MWKQDEITSGTPKEKGEKKAHEDASDEREMECEVAS